MAIGQEHDRRLARMVVRPGISLVALMATDLLSLLIAGSLAVFLKYALDWRLEPTDYISLLPVVAIFILTYASWGLYPGVGLAPAEELRRIVHSTTLIYLVLGSATFLFKEGDTYSRGVFALAWFFSIVLVPLNRAILRHLCAKKYWWGVPVIILGAGETGKAIVRILKEQPGLGLKPVAILDDDSNKLGSICGVPIMGGIDEAPSLAREMGIRYAVIAMPGVPRERLLSILESHTRVFTRIILIPDLFGFSSLWVNARDLGGLLGLEVRQNLLLPIPRMLKRAVDISASLFGGLLTLPILLLIAALVKLDSPGPILYGHTRIGQGGKRFKAWKFRSMVKDADKVLGEYLNNRPELKAEWEANQKLKDDPRVTRVGRWLRKLSLDELPQLWNVLKGEMSLVGPRPVVREELARYGKRGVLYLKVKPGMTGLWQVSGRSDTSYAERVEMDAYYVRNWSIWLDLYILARTVWVVLFGRGAF